MAKQNTTKRTIGRVTTGAGAGVSLAGAVTVLVVYIVSVTTGVELPDHVVTALTVIISTVAALIGGYLVPPRTVPDGAGRRRADNGDAYGQ